MSEWTKEREQAALQIAHQFADTRIGGAIFGMRDEIQRLRALAGELAAIIEHYNHIDPGWMQCNELLSRPDVAALIPTTGKPEE